MDFKKIKVNFRGIQDREDLNELKVYHDEWFPIKYNDIYFE